MGDIVNNAKTRRAAHRFGRQKGGNPFALTFGKRDDKAANTDGSDRRHHTFDAGADLESQRGVNFGNDDGETGSPIVHSNTAPERFLGRGADAKDAVQPGSSKDKVQSSPDQSQPNSDDTFVDSRGPTTDTSDQAVRRRTANLDKESKSTGNGARDDNGKTKKEKAKLIKHVYPKEPFTVRNQIQRTIFNSWINVLIIAAPLGIALNFVPSVNKIAIFVINFIAIIPLAAMLSFATEEIALRTGETLGGLLNATFGNAVELIVAIIALAHKEVVIVQTSLIGSILSNLLLVMGMCFFCGGLNRREQHFNTVVAQTAASLLALAVAAVIVPTVFDKASNTPTLDVAKLSRGTSVILLFVYGAYLFFQLKTHAEVFAEESQKVEGKPFNNPFKKDQKTIKNGLVDSANFMTPYGVRMGKDDTDKLRALLRTPPHVDDDDGDEPQLSFVVAVATLAISTIIIAFCAEFMVDGISAVTAGGAVSAEFVGLILLPIVGNAAEHATAVTVAIKDKMDLAIGVAVGSSMQVALFIIPLLVIIGWGMDMDDMSLSFDLFQVAVLFVAVLLVNYLIADGKSHWLEGMLLMSLYLIIAVCSWCESFFSSKCCLTQKTDYMLGYPTSTDGTSDSSGSSNSTGSL
ncbi:Calcium/proton exchanger [Diplogelasinospora grovesii]|uniref:Calcium/proton exchanger n=1 Tax=Diplogelasinospora grovesii TaxID=303347 RepID=A0AAN6NGY3_9PEZI|nr:Calcium/proton exchanger [Diplogelasinospora grovesii]